MKKEAQAVQLKACPLISEPSHSSHAAPITAKTPFKSFKGHTVWSLRPARPGARCERVVYLARADVWPGKLDGEYSWLRPCREFQGGSPSWPPSDPLLYSTHGQTATPYCKNATRWPPYPFSAWLCGYGLTGWRPRRAFSFFLQPKLFRLSKQWRLPHKLLHDDKSRSVFAAENRFLTRQHWRWNQIRQ